MTCVNSSYIYDSIENNSQRLTQNWIPSNRINFSDYINTTFRRAVDKDSNIDNLYFKGDDKISKGLKVEYSDDGVDKVGTITRINGDKISIVIDAENKLIDKIPTSKVKILGKKINGSKLRYLYRETFSLNQG